MKRDFLINSAPGKNLIRKISDELDIEAYKQLYELRKLWSQGYPLVHDGLITYGILDDLHLDADEKLFLLPTTMQIALEEDNEYFHVALYLVESMIPDDRISPRPPDFGKQLLKLRELALKQKDRTNLKCTWNTLAVKSKCLRPQEPDESYELSAKELSID